MVEWYFGGEGAAAPRSGRVVFDGEGAPVPTRTDLQVACWRVWVGWGWGWGWVGGWVGGGGGWVFHAGYPYMNQALVIILSSLLVWGRRKYNLIPGA